MNAYAEKPHDGIGGSDPNAVIAHGYAIIANAQIALRALIPSTQAPKQKD
jgi:hypothetical protein